MTLRSFDLNMEEVLENWEVEHAIREIIANALDEQVLTGGPEPTITKDDGGTWHIRDFGRGLKIEHFTLNENQEKLRAPSGVIGKFGVGLKDALGTFHRRGIEVLIRSSHGTYRLKREAKHGFQDIVTLHVEYDNRPTELVGTEFILGGVTDSQMTKAKALFLKFSNVELIESTEYGQILSNRDGAGRVYILGVLASEEPSFLFSYNVTSLTESMKKRLNRERLNVGRGTYTDRVKSILKSSTSEKVRRELILQVEERASGQQCDEMAWADIAQMAFNLMSKRLKPVFLTEQEVLNRPGVVDTASSEGYHVVVVTQDQKDRLTAQTVAGGPVARTLEQFIIEYGAAFRYKFIDPERLSTDERRIYDLTPRIVSLIGATEILAPKIPKVLISATLRPGIDSTEGVWDPRIPAIVIRRSALRSLTGYAGVLLHEVAHALTSTHDVSREFENVLSTYLGCLAVAALKEA